MSRGGARPGAGRKPGPGKKKDPAQRKVRLNIVILPETAALIEAEVKKGGKKQTPGRVIDERFKVTI